MKIAYLDKRLLIKLQTFFRNSKLYYFTIIVLYIFTPVITHAQSEYLFGLTAVCEGQTATYYVDSAPEDEIHGYGSIIYASWSASGTITQQEPSWITVAWNNEQWGTVQVFYEVRYQDGSILFYEGSLGVSISPRPTITLSGPPAVCAGTGGHIYSTEGGMDGYFWNVSPGGTVTSGGGQGTHNNTATITWNTPGIHSVSVQSYNSAGCGSEPVTHNVTVNSLPSQAVINGPATPCLNSPGNRYETQSGMNGYEWQLPAGAEITSGGGSNNFVDITWRSLGTKNINVRYRQGDCWGGYGSLAVNVKEALMPTITSGPTQVCTGASGTYSTQSGKTQYEWIVSPGGTRAAGGGSGDPTITVNWHTAGANSVQVKYKDGQCAAATYGVRNVVVNAAPAPVISSGPTSVCVGTTGNVYTTLAGQTGYQWAITPGAGSITAGGGPGDNQVTITWSTAGTREVSVNYTGPDNCQSAIPGKRTVQVIQPPAIVTDVAGLKLNFTNEPSLQEVNGSADATQLNWRIVSGGSATFIEAGGSIPGRRIKITTASAGNYVFSVTPQKDGCEGQPFLVHYTSLSNALKNSAVVMMHPELSALAEGYLFLPRHSPHYTGCIQQLGPITIKAQLDLGDEYNLGENVFNSTVNATITAYADLPGSEQSWTIPFTLSQNGPEQLFIKTIAINPALVRFIKIRINSYTNPTTAAQNAIRLRTWFEENNDVVTIHDAVVSPNTFVPDHARWEQTFSWTTSCTDVPDYIFQLLRIYGNESVDWNNALNIHTENAATSLTLSLAEGSGAYRWRVTPLGNLEGGIANPANRGTPSAVSAFNYEHPEEEKNWIYSRTFTEGNHIREQVTYANGLQQIAQQQTKIQGDNQIVASKILHDFVGRNALSSLPVPVAGANKLGYVNNLLKNTATGSPYKAADFDTDPKNPAAATDFGGYYSDDPSNPINQGVANAKGYPFAQTIFTPDGTGRVREQGGVGYTHSVKGGKTVRTFYAHPSEPELVRLFGKETPDIRSVQKITTFDANNTASISYQTKDGKVLATALAITSTSGQLNAIPSASSATISFTEEVKGNERLDDRTLVSRKPLFVESDRQLTVDYEIKPQVLETLCRSENTNGGMPCKTCDYKVDILLYKEGDAAPVTLGSKIIPAFSCAGKDSAQWNPMAFIPITLSAGINYVLEKRITTGTVNAATSQTYVDKNATQVENYYRSQLDSRLHVIETFLNTGDIAGLYTYLRAQGYSYDSAQQQYIVPLMPAGAAGCQEFLYVPYNEPCPAEDVLDATTCKLNGKTFEEYFASYYADHDTITPLRPDGKLSYVFFKNRYTAATNPVQANLYFTPGEFDNMVANMMVDNQLSCSLVWEVWKQEVQGYEAKDSITFESNPEAADYPFASPENNLFQNFLLGIEARLQQALEQDQQIEQKDICLNRPELSSPYFIRKSNLYGYFKSSAGATSTVVAPDLLHAYRLAYFNDNVPDHSHNKALKFYRGTGVYTKVQVEDPLIVPTQADFNALSECDRYRFFSNTQIGNENISEEQGGITKIISKMRDNCAKACEARAGEFRQAIIRSLFAQNPNTRIEHYNVYLDEIMDGDSVLTGIQAMYVGVYDANVNTTGFTIGVCEFDALVDGLIENCKNNYCDTELTPHEEPHPDKPGYTVKVYGTEEEREKLSKPFTHNFEVEVTPLAQACASGWDQIINTGKPLDDITYDPAEVPALRDFQFGVIAKVSNPADFDYVWTVTKTTDVPSNTPIDDPSMVGTLKWAVMKANAANGRSLINFNIPGPAPHTITLTEDMPGVNNGNLPAFEKAITVDGNTQPANGFTGGKLPKIKIINSQYLFTLSLGSDFSEIKGLLIENITGTTPPDFGLSVPIHAFFVEGIKIIGNIFMNSSSMDNTHMYCIRMWPIKNSIIQGNIIGTSVDYQLQRGYSQSIDLDDNSQIGTPASVNNLIGGPTINHGNIVANTWGYSGAVSLQKFYNNEIETHNTFENNVIFNTSPKPQFPNAQALIIGPNTSYGNRIWSINHVRKNILFNNRIRNWILTTPGIYYDVSNKRAYGTLQYAGTIDLFLSRTGKDYFEYIGTGRTKLNNASWELKDVTIPVGWTLLGIVDNNVEGYRPQNFSYVRTCLSITHSLCFRFTQPKNLSIPIPEGMEDHVFNPVPETCTEYAVTAIRESLQQQKEQIIDSRVRSYRNQYYASCGDPSLIQDKLTLSYSTGVHHFTLYYYDRAGNLIRTVPPQGVAFLPVNTPANLATARNTFPNHTLVTEYQYNSMGQLVQEHTPDANYESAFPNDYIKPAANSTESAVNASPYYATHIYNDKGQLRFSRNAKQKKENTFSYTKYDALGRIIELGECPGFLEATLMAKRNETGRHGFPEINIRQVTSTYYTDAYGGTLPQGYTQKHLSNRVSYSILDEDGDPATAGDQVTTVYSYDAHGNVAWLAQLIPGLAPIAVQYEYDLISNKVTAVKYNPGHSDQFFHRYEHDANNRITAVLTSKEGVLWEREATYEYYKHGPLKRTVIGEDLVQGIDYTYTIQGWLKGLNHQYLDITNDPMKDADVTEARAGAKNHLTGRDAFGMALGYYTGDYKRAGSSFDSAHASTLVPSAGKDLYNGNITSWASNGGGWASATRYPTMNLAYKGLTGYRYTYDDLNRLRTASFVYGTAYTVSNIYRSEYTYTANGNIATANVFGLNDNFYLDNLVYNYIPGTHRLREVNEAYAATPASMDVEKQQPNNYQYDAIGNLTGDVKQGTAITWTPYGKVKEVTKTGGYTTSFLYDAAGNRVQKKRTNPGGVSTIDYYVRDAAGNIMGVYQRIDQGGTQGETILSEVPLYGTERIGVYNKSITVDQNVVTPLQPDEVRLISNTTKNAYEGLSYLLSPATVLNLEQGFEFDANTSAIFSVRTDGINAPEQSELYTRTLNNRRYELKDHLDNVRAVIGDVKLSSIANNVPGNFEPKLLTLSNYYPFGMDQPDRMWSAVGKYRYGFNGKEKDDTGEWGQTAYDYGFRIYDPSIGKFLSVDPLTKSYPWYTPYQFAGNTPIQAIDLDGLEEKYVKGKIGLASTTIIEKETAKKVVEKSTKWGVNKAGELVKLGTNSFKFLGRGISTVLLVFTPADPGETAIYASMKNWEKYRFEELTNKELELEEWQKYELQQLSEKYAFNSDGEVVPKWHVSIQFPGTYEINLAHVPNSGSYKPNKSVLPKNHEELWNSRLYKDEKGDYWAVEKDSKGKNPVFHRFEKNNNNKYHWNRSTNGKTKDGTDYKIRENQVPNELKLKVKG